MYNNNDIMCNKKYTPLVCLQNRTLEFDCIKHNKEH